MASARDAFPRPTSRPLGRRGPAYRAWARQAPELFALILGMPVPGYVAHEEGPTTEAAKRAMSQLSACSSAAKLGELGRPLIREVRRRRAAAPRRSTPSTTAVPPESFQAMLHAWAGLHGFTASRPTAT